MNWFEEQSDLYEKSKRRSTPKVPCQGGCMAYHVHECLDGSWAVFFDEIDQKVGFKTREAAEQAMNDLKKN